MNQRLIVLMDETWPADPVCPWVLVNAQDKVLQHGNSAPKHWPAEASLELVLSAPQCAWHTVKLPLCKRRDEARLMAYALEHRLVKDTDSQHLTPTHRSSAPDGIQTSVLAVSEQRMRALLAQLAAIERLPNKIVAEQTLAPFDPAQPTHWHLSWAHPHYAVLRTGPAEAYTLDAQTLPTLLPTLLARAPSPGPSTLISHTSPGLNPPALAPLSEATPLTLQTGEPYAWWQGTQYAANLLHGEFQNKNSARTWHAFKWPALLIALSLVTLMLFNLGEVFWLRSQMQDVQTRMRRILETSLPNTPAINPSAQLTQALETAKAAQGQMRSSDALALWSAYSQARGAQLAQDSLAKLSYNAPRLELSLNGATEAELTQLRTQLAQQGINCEVLQTNPPKLALTRSLNP